MLHYFTRLAVESLLALSCVLTGTDASDAYEQIETSKQLRICGVVKSRRTHSL